MVLPLGAAALIGAQLLPAIGGFAMSRRQKANPYEAQLKGNISQIGDLANLSMNPEDPRYKNMVGQEEQYLRQNFSTALRDMIEANRRQALMGRQQIFDPERRDEAMFSQLQRNNQAAGQQANNNVLNRINNSMGALSGQQQGISSLANMQNQRGAQSQQNILAALSGLSGAAGTAGKYFYPGMF